ncbi:hypothetical protein FKW77_002167 [Venturia effusa]|uniref:Uncharacterized protein n=1 Tax=Venturia effusa TaxID=50376 RepID=A0A517LEY3_9PEZI|nr:hypothetical protein FKW77_002167 [Venturia effusa]
MAQSHAPYLYTETRLNLDQAHTASTVEITLPSSRSSVAFAETVSEQRNVVSDIQVGCDESIFAKEHLATDASIFFRRDGRYPRSFLWRLLDDRKALEIQSVDLSEDVKEKTEALLTLILRFPAAIRPFCIAFADSDDTDAIDIFAITTTNELWTLTLLKDHFVRLKSTENMPTGWCRCSQPSVLKTTKAYRLFASNSKELYVSLEDGGFLELTRQAGDDGSIWYERSFSEGHWGSSITRSIWKSRKAAQFGDLSLEPTAILSAASSGFEGEEEHLVTVCLNHMLRIWDLTTGKILGEVDILGETDERESRYLMGPSQRQLMQIFDMPSRHDHYYIATYTPKRHRFRFWEISTAGSGRECIREMRDEVNFTPPIDRLMDTAVWNLEEFYLRPAQSTASQGHLQTRLWIRVRAGQTSQIFTINFDPCDFEHGRHEAEEHVNRCWKSDWIAVAHGRQTVEALDAIMPQYPTEESSESEIVNIEDRWLSALLYPGRLSVPTLETALEVYCKARNHVFSARDGKASLKDRLTKAINASSGTGSREGAQEWSGQDAKKVADQWQVYYELVRDLHKRRSDALSFAVDPCDQLPWAVCSDFVAPIRTCNDVELCEYNRDALEPVSRGLIATQDEQPVQENAEMGRLLRFAHSYRACLSSPIQDSLHRLVLAEILEESSLSVMDRFHALQGQVGLDVLSDDDFERMENLVTENGGFYIFQTRNFEHVIETMQVEISGKITEEQITRFGTRTMIRTAQEMIAMNTNVLLDLLSIVMSLEGNYEPEDLAAAINVPPGDDELMDIDQDSETAFQPARLFMMLARGLREYAVLNFLTSNVRQEQRKHRKPSAADSPEHKMSGPAPPSEPTYNLTLLESMFIGDWSSIRAPENKPTPDLITYMCGAWLTNLNIEQYDNFTAYVLADLIKHDDLRLARDFLPFVPETGWSTYLQGRLNIKIGDADGAMANFKKAAFSMSIYSFNVNNSDKAGLLRPDEYLCFADGLAPYYEHVMALLGTIKAHSHIVELANLALQAHAQKKPQAQHGQQPDKAELHEYHRRKSGLLTTNLFPSALATQDFQQAYSVLNRLPTATRHFHTKQFIEAVVDNNRIELLLGFPWTGLEEDADDILAKKVKDKGWIVSAKPEWHKILYAWRVKRGNWRGAAQVAFDRLERLKATGEATRIPSDERLVEAYLLLINSLACVAPEEAWVIREAQVVNPDGTLARTNGARTNGHTGGSKRCVVSIEDVRREYQAELDRLAQLEQGDFAFSGDGADGMDFT